MRIYNTLTRKKEIFRPLVKGRVGLYTCGPTVYNYAHIGNLRTYLFEDVLERALLRAGYEVKRIMNVTDVGHLTSDADAGEDKLEKGAKREKKSPWDIAKFYTKAFLKDLKTLNVRKPAELAPATRFIPEQITLIEELFSRGYAYETTQAVYFDVSKFKSYGKLSGNASRANKKQIGANVRRGRTEVFEDPEKRNPEDFALWFKRVGRFKHHIMHWSSPWGVGFPGWHLECSAISSSLLGQPFDIHCGGIDHISVHHTNEIAQSEAAHGKPLAKYWMHGAFLIMNLRQAARKMSKSAGTFVTLADVAARGFDPLSYRLFALGAHYRAELNFTWDALRAAENALKKLRREVARLKGGPMKGDARKPGKPYAAYQKKFNEAIFDDLNTPRALSALWAVAWNAELTRKEKLNLILSFDEVLGLGLKEVKKLAPIPAMVAKLAEARELYRRNKQFDKADALRTRIAALGYTVEDTADGPVVHRKS